MKKVMVFGTFDVLHEGHKNFFMQARELGELLVCVVARDSTLKEIGKEVLDDENKRAENVKKTKLADKVILGNSGDKYLVIKQERPDVISLGYDQTYFTQGLEEWLKEKRISAQIVRLKPYKEYMYKSSIIRKRILKKQN